MNPATWLQRSAACIGAALRARNGLARGERGALFAANTPAYLEALFAIFWAGLAAVPINAKLHAREAQFIVEDSGATLCLVDEEHGGALGAALADRTLIEFGSTAFERLRDADPMPLERVAPDALAWLLYTSGTTGKPKGVMLSHANLATMTMCDFSDVDTVDRDDSIVYAAPISHGAGIYSFAHVLRGARHVVPQSGRFDPPEILALAARHRRVSMFAAPTMVHRLVEHVAASGANCEGIRTIVYGGGPMYQADIPRALDVMGQRFVQIYGQGESPMTITALSRADLADTAHPHYLARLASVGVAQSAVEVAVVGADGEPVATGEVGEVVVAVIAPRGERPPDPAELDALCFAHVARFKRPKRFEFVASLPKNNYGKVLKTDLRARFAGS
ncbi:MAG: AMP-binding protein [Burkholderiaceae bacterium]|nr:AMP-binding protein [Burkholderiaceae bacterium]